jgi:hypothetical protein
LLNRTGPLRAVRNTGEAGAAGGDPRLRVVGVGVGGFVERAGQPVGADAVHLGADVVGHDPFAGALPQVADGLERVLQPNVVEGSGPRFGVDRADGALADRGLEGEEWLVLR